MFIVGLIVKVGFDLLFGAIKMCLPPAVVEEELRLRDLGRCSLLTRGISGSLSDLILAIILFYPVFPEFQSRSLASWTWAAVFSRCDEVGTTKACSLGASICAAFVWGGFRGAFRPWSLDLF